MKQVSSTAIPAAKIKNKFCGAKGFTLIEILVYVAVLSIIVVAISSFSIWAIHSNTKARAMREVKDMAQTALEQIISEAREAKTVYTPTTNASQLSLETTKYLPLGEESTFLEFYLCQTRLCLKKEGQNPIALTSDRVEVKNLSFQRVASGQTDSVQVELRVDYKNPASKPEYAASITLKSTASLRGF